MGANERRLASGNEAVTKAAWDVGVALGTGYPGTPSTEILETFSMLGGRAQWSPNEKVALEVALARGDLGCGDRDDDSDAQHDAQPSGSSASQHSRWRRGGPGGI